MSNTLKSVSHSLERMMDAARRLQNIDQRITQEEIDLLGECGSRLRLIRGPGKIASVESTSTPAPDLASTAPAAYPPAAPSIDVPSVPGNVPFDLENSPFYHMGLRAIAAIN